MDSGWLGQIFSAIFYIGSLPPTGSLMTAVE